MAEPFLTRHAIQRYRERVADVPAAEVWRALDCAAVRVAIDFGARFVRLAGGAADRAGQKSRGHDLAARSSLQPAPARAR
ncbi:MAG: hypothetical protein U0975_09805 [Erythrobacter sp.]|nr:hypothetical protein [Erythrobacter sp.]MDZ4272955.1 hypothetical protein [Erythrobacter sp.]